MWKFYGEFLIDFYAGKEWQIFLQSRNCSDIRTLKVGRKGKKTGF